MPKHCRIHVPGENRLLVALSKDEYHRLLPHLEKVSLPLKDILYEANGPIAHVFFRSSAWFLWSSWTASSPSK